MTIRATAYLTRPLEYVHESEVDKSNKPTIWLRLLFPDYSSGYQLLGTPEPSYSFTVFYQDINLYRIAFARDSSQLFRMDCLQTFRRNGFEFVNNLIE